jgi:hypothetical protein
MRGGLEAERATGMAELDGKGQPKGSRATRAGAEWGHNCLEQKKNGMT